MKRDLGRSVRSRSRIGVVMSVTGALIMAASITTVQVASAANSDKQNTCPPIYLPGTVIDGGLEVAGPCVLTGVIINGGVQIDSTGHLTLYASTVNGGTDVQPGGEFDSNFPEVNGGANVLNGGISADNAVDMDIHGGIIQGRVLFNGELAGSIDRFTLCGVNLQGDLTIENFPAALATNGINIGDVAEGDDFAAICANGNTISGSVTIRDNPGSRIELETNTIGGSAQIWNSQPSVTANTIGGSLQCHTDVILGLWDADDTNTNNVNGNNSCS